MGRFRTAMTLVQPSIADGADGVRHQVMARPVDDGGGSVGIVDGAVAAPAGATWEIDRPPRGLGTRWRAVVDGVPHQIDSVVQPQDHRHVVRVDLSSTALTGELAVPGGTVPARSPSPPPADHGGPGTGS